MTETRFILSPSGWLLTGIVLFLSSMYWHMTKYRPTNSQKLPPGPFRWPVVGCVPQLVLYLYWYRMNQAEVLEYLQESYGKIFCIKIMGLVLVIASDRQLVRDALNEEGLSDRPKGSLSDEMTGAYWKTYGDGIKTLRRIMIAGVTGKLGCDRMTVEEIIHSQCVSLCSQVESQTGKPFYIMPKLRKATAKVILSILFGEKVPFSDKNVEEFATNMSSLVSLAGVSGIRMFIPYLSKFRSEKIRKMLGYIEFMKGFIEQIITTYNSKPTPQPGDPHVMFDMLVNEIRKSDDFISTMAEREEIIQNVLFALLLGGFETTALTISKILTFMVEYPDVQRRVQEELEKVVGDDRNPTMSDKGNLPYTNAVISEMLRYIKATNNSPGFMRMANKTVTLNGYTIPKGALFVPHSGALHRDASVWSDPLTFRAERFMGEKNGGLHNDIMMFGSGKRRCVGEALVKMELFLFLTHLLHHFNVCSPEAEEKTQTSQQSSAILENQLYNDFNGSISIMEARKPLLLKRFIMRSEVGSYIGSGTHITG